MKLKTFIIFIGCTLVVGCSDPKIDTSTDEAMKSSIAKVRESLPEVKKQEFDEAMQVLFFSSIDIKDIFSAGAAGASKLEGKMKESLNGKSGVQIIAEANQIKIEREKKEREQALQEIVELEKKRKASLAAREELKKFKVLRSRFYKTKREYLGEQPIIELKVKNETSMPISRVYFEGTIASTGRSVPWHKDNFNYQISGGLEPNEEGNWTLAPNMFSDWGKVEAPTDAIFTVTVEGVDGADGQSLYSTGGFGERESKRLDELKQKYISK